MRDVTRPHPDVNSLPPPQLLIGPGLIQTDTVELTRAHRLVWLALGMLAMRLLLALIVIPPWQHPDEPQHVLFARILSLQREIDVTATANLELEQEMVQSMAANGWWHHYGRSTPDPLPTHFSDGPESPFQVNGLRAVPDGPTLFYRVTGFAFRMLGITDLLHQLYALRTLSAAFGLLTLWCAWAGARLLFGDETGVGVVWLLAVHPQFALVSTAANPDSFVNLCGGLLWWQAARMMTNVHAIVSLVSLLAAAIAAVLVRRVGLPLLGSAAVLTLIHLTTRWTHDRRLVLRALVAAVGVIGLSIAALWIAPEELQRMIAHVGGLLGAQTSEEVTSWQFFAAFSRGLFDTSWLVGGWLAYPAPDLWYGISRTLVLVALFGVPLAFVRSDRQWRTGLALALLIVGLQLVAAYVAHYRIGRGAQGRYLFPAIAPFLSLVWIGFTSWAPERFVPLVGALLVMIAALLDIAGWTNVLLPAYGR